MAFDFLSKISWRRVFKRVTLGILALVLIMVFFMFFGVGLKYMQFKILSNRADSILNEMKTQNEKEIAYQKSDFAGGKTPEETLDLLLVALKKNDATTSSSYYRVDKKDSALKKFNDELSKNKSLSESLKWYEGIRNKGVKKCGIEVDWCAIEYYSKSTEDKTYSNRVGSQDVVVTVPKGTNERIGALMTINIFTKVWKIEF
jgi:hypothetical protein